MPTVSRRSLVKGTALAGAALTAISLAGCGDAGDDNSIKLTGEPQVIEDDSLIVNVIDEFKSVDNTLAEQASWDLPLGTLPFHSEGLWAALLQCPESARSVNTLGVISLSSGNVSTLVETPTQGKAFGFHAVRCSESVFAWVEMNYRTGDWLLIAQALSNGGLTGEPVELDRGNADWEPARFATTGATVIWQKMPLASGSKRAEASHCYAWNVGDAEGTEIYESKGRFATWPQVSDGMLTITPRVKQDEGTYYGLTALDIQNSYKLTDQLVMPSTVAPFEAVYMNGSFAFSVEANYGYGGVLGNMGTFIGREGGPYTYLSREPLACVAGKGSRYLIKVRSSHVMVDTEAQEYSVLVAPDRCLDYGDYPASVGTTDNFVTYATVRDDEGLPSVVRLRVFGL